VKRQNQGPFGAGTYNVPKTVKSGGKCLKNVAVEESRRSRYHGDIVLNKKWGIEQATAADASIIGGGGGEGGGQLNTKEGGGGGGGGGTKNPKLSGIRPRGKRSGRKIGFGL